jgi:hypothetical protein
VTESGGPTEGSPLLDRAGIQRALTRLGERLHRRGVVADLYVVGGAAIALAFDARRATRDIDALFVPHGIVLDEARAVADELGLTTEIFPDEPVPDRARPLVEDLFT